MAARKVRKTTEDVLLILCESVKKILTIATKSDITYSPMIQKTIKTCLRPDIGCFVLFQGGFSGLVVMNFSSGAAVEVYRRYLMSMGLPEEELATYHTSDDVGNSLGELMNQIVGNFQAEVKRELRVSVNQNQPKMIVLNQELLVAVNAKIDSPQCRRASFETADHHPFYVELAMEKTEFILLFPFEKDEDVDPEKIIEEHRNEETLEEIPTIDHGKADLDFMKELGL